MSLPYPAILNTIFYHQLLYPFGGVCEIDNSSPFYCYVALGPKASVSDIMSQNVAVISPYQKRAFSVNVHNTTPSLSIVPTDKPFAFPRAIGGSQAVIRVSEYSNPKVFFNSPTFDGLAADYIIIAGGLIEANQQGLYARNPTGGEVLAVNLDANHAWDGVTMQPGDVMIGRGANSLYWNDAAGTLSINSGSIVRAVSTDVVFGPSGLGAIWSAGSVRLSDGRTIATSSGSLAAFGAGVQYLTIDPGGALSQPFDVFAWDDLPYGYLVIAVVVSDGVHPVSVIVSLGGTLISGGQIVTGSIVTGNLAATAIDGMTITGATIRTNSAAVPDVKIDPAGIKILADSSDHVEWVDGSGAISSKIQGQIQTTGTTFNRLLFLVNPLFNRSRAWLSLSGFSSSGNGGGVEIDVGPGGDHVQIAYSNTGSGSIIFRLKNYFAELFGDASIQGFVVGGSGGSPPGAMLDVRGVVLAGSGFNSGGSAGLTRSVVIPALTALGFPGRLDFTGGILTGVIDPT